MKRSIRFLIVIVVLVSTKAWAQPGNPIFGLTAEMGVNLDLQSLAILDIESSENVNFTLSFGTLNEAGDGFVSNPLATNTDTWINYSSAINAGTRRIEAHISSGTVPTGLELHLDVAASSGMSSGGTLGTAALSTIILSSTPQTAISAIQGAFTGDGASNGHQLTYSLHVVAASYAALENATTPIVITYTFMDD